MTKHGWFSWQDLGEANAKLTTDPQGRRIIRFPVSCETVNGHAECVYRDIPDHIIDAGPGA